MGNLTGISIAGPDDKTSIDDLARLTKRYPYVEWGVLYYPEKEGHPRNPTKAWREQFLSQIPKKNTAIHLCGEVVFNQILDDSFDTSELKQELSHFGRIQLNINARKIGPPFTNAQFALIYQKLLAAKFTIIVQYNTISSTAIEDFIINQKFNKQFVHILLDSSLGKGVTPDKWTIPELFKKHYKLGFAGGLKPGSIFGAYLDIDTSTNSSFYLDLESGVRTENEFDLEKVEDLLILFMGEFDF